MSAKTAILTGANGFIGSYLVQVLLKRGWTVHVLGRSKEGVSWQERVLTAVRTANVTDMVSDLNRLHCWEADLTRPDLGFSTKPVSFGEFKAVLVHLAGDTRFVPTDPAAQRRANVDGALNVVRALRPFISRVVHVSTAYVAGDRTGTILESEMNVGQGFHNNYEKTKLEAEVAMRALCEEVRLPLAIVRPSIIVNDTVNGRSSAFTHLNVLVEVANRIQEFYGIKDGEVVNREIRVPMNPSARPNTAAVDPIAHALALVAESPDSAGRTFHLCHPSPQSNAEIFALVLEAFGIKEKISLNFTQEMSKPLTRTEEMVLRAFKVYLPYLNHSAVFDLTNTRGLIPGYDGMFQPASVDYLRKVIAFERTERKK
ncbi:MAG: SDR family oxidoreductase [Verrucomicrobia bacterium]|nr:SDR family oxidoreductase [Verrucomicrobiota bacterium]